MPVNSTRPAQRASMGSAMQQNGLGPLNTTSFLFDDNEDKHLSLNGSNDITSPIAKAYMQLGGDDKFPTLRSNGASGLVRALIIIDMFTWLTSTLAFRKFCCFGPGQLEIS